MLYLLLMEDGSETVEQLEWGQDLALHEYASDDGGGCPPAGADGHLKEPLLEGHACTLSTKHGHGCGKG